MRCIRPSPSTRWCFSAATVWPKASFDWSFAGVSNVAFCISAGMFAMFLYLTLYIQDVLGYSPLEAGLRFLPLSVVSFFVAPLSAKLSARIPFRALMGTGLFLVAIGLRERSKRRRIAA